MKSRNDEQERIERVMVCCRLRPFTADEYAKEKLTCIDTFDADKKIVVIKKDYDKKVFTFDDLLDPRIDQEEAYSSIAKNVIESVLKGFNGTIFAYGQTGTGKTYTMMGVADSEKKRGIIPRALEHIFKDTSADKHYKYDIKIGYLQIYMEMLQDLIEPSNVEIRIRESSENGVFITGNAWVPVRNTNECLKIISNAEKNRAVAFTNLNAHSSRSHAVLMVKLEKRFNYSSDQLDKIEKEKNLDNTAIVYSVLYLVDLAGSERVKKSKVSGDRLDEAISINYSLTALGKCIHALTDSKVSYVPFRESKLTRILQDSLGGNSKTVLVVNIGPSIRNLEETLSALQFGSRAMKVQNKPIINRTQDYYAISLQLQAELDTKDDQLHKMEIRVSQLVDELTNLKNEYEILRIQNFQIEMNSNNLKQSITSSSNSKQTLEAFEQNKKREIAAVEQKYRELIAKTEEEHKVFLEEIDKMMLEQENEITDLKKTIDEQNDKINGLETSKTEYLAMINQKTIQYEEKVKGLEAEVENLKKLLNDSLAEKTILSGKLTESEDKTRELEKKMQYTIKQELEMVKKRENDSNLRVKDLEYQISKLNQELNNERKEKISNLKSTQSEKDQLNNFLQNLKKEKEEMSKRESELLKKTQELEDKISKLEDNDKKERKSTQIKVDSLIQEKERLYEKIKNINFENEELKKNENELLAMIKELEIGKNSLRDELVRMLNDNVNKDKQFTKNLESMNKALRDREDQINQLSGLIKEKDQIIMQLNKTLKDQFDTISVKNVELEKIITQKDMEKSELMINFKDQAEVYQKKIEELNNLIQAKFSENDSMSKYKSAYESKIADLNDLLRLKNAENDSLKKTITNSGVTYEERISEILNRSQEMKANELETLTSKISEMEKDLNTKTSLINSLNLKLKEKEKEINDLKGKITQLNIEKDENVYTITLLQNERDGYMDQIKETEIIAKENEAENVTLKQLNDELKEENESLKEEINNMSIKCDETMKKFEELSILFDELKSKKNELREENSKLKEMLNQSGGKEKTQERQEILLLKKDIIDLKNEILEYTKKLKEAQVLYNQLQKENTDWKRKYTELENELNKVIEQQSELEVEYESVINEKVKDHEHVKKQYEKKIEELKNDLINASQSLHNSGDTNEEQVYELKRKIEILEEERNNLVNKFSMAKSNLEGVIAQKEEEITLLNELIKEQIHQLEILRHQNENFEKKNNLLEGSTEDSKSQIQRDDSSKFRSIESHFSFNSKVSDKEKEDIESRLRRELEESRNTNLQFKDKCRRIETDLKTISKAKHQLEVEKKIQVETLQHEICELVLDNMIQSLQMKEFQNYVKQIINLRESVTAVYDSNLHPLKQWLGIVSNSQNSHARQFSSTKFNSFIDNLVVQVHDFNSSAKLYERFYSQELIPLDKRPIQIDLMDNNNNHHNKQISFGYSSNHSYSSNSSLRSSRHSLNSRKNALINEEVNKVMDYMIFLVEIENEIESQINVDFSMINLNSYVDKKLNNYMFTSPTKNAAKYYSKGTGTPKKFTNIEEVPTIDIFTKKYNMRIQRLFEKFNPSYLSTDFVYCNSKLLEKIFTINKEMTAYITDNKDLIVELTKLFANSYNLSLYLTSKLQFKDEIISDLQGILELCIGTQTHKELQLKIAGREKKLLLKKFQSSMRTANEDNRILVSKSQKLEEKARYERGAMIIQAIFRKRKQDMMTKMALISNFILMKKKQSLNQMSKSYNQSNSKTGKFIIHLSMNKLSQVFSNLNDTFTEKKSAHYLAIKDVFNSKKQENQRWKN